MYFNVMLSSNRRVSRPDQMSLPPVRYDQKSTSFHGYPLGSKILNDKSEISIHLSVHHVYFVQIPKKMIDLLLTYLIKLPLSQIIYFCTSARHC